MFAISGVNQTEVKDRLAAVNTLLTAESKPASVTVGVAELQTDDSLETLLERADGDLYRQRAESV